jgi:glycerol-3-phosphate dehydrogenase
MQTVLDLGGCAINYAGVTGLLKNAAGELDGASVLDAESGKTHSIKAKAVVNATGVFVDDILQMDNASAPKSICVSQGIHLVLDKKFFPSTHGLMIPETSDGRVLFAVPWYGKVVLGTTDTPVEKASLEPQALESEINFILQTAAGYLTQKPQKSDVLSVFAGLRPLAVPKQTGQKTKEISRSHKVVVSPSNLFSIIGGKWTTFRKMGEDTVSAIEKRLSWSRRSSGTARLHIHGYATGVDGSNPFSFYGSDWLLLKQKLNGEGEEEWISERLKIHAVQVLWAVENEMARTVEDVLSRRTRALLLDARESIRICPRVAEIMAGALAKNEDWIAEQVKQYTSLAQAYLLASNTDSA